MLSDLNLPIESQDGLRNRSPEEQWSLVKNHMRTRGATDEEHAAQELAEGLRAIRQSCEFDSEQNSIRRNHILDEMAVALRSKPLHYILKFVELDGLTLMLDLLASITLEERCVTSSVSGLFGTGVWNM